ncbi:MAG TPA: cytochrome c biogenesis protein CcdA [Longimicrobiales bacterium]|nr:cytochrome c biogenesis protein CcdA [Longimicrobiales bacterium]
MEHLLHGGALDALQSISLLAFGIVFAAGLAMGLAPSSYALYPVVVGYVAGEEDEVSGRRGLSLALAFVLGTATVDAALGALFGLIGGVVIEVVARYVVLWNALVAALLIVFGLALLRIFRVKWPVLKMTWRKAHSIPGAYALGIPFGLTACPACTPMMLPMLAAAAATGTWWFGALLMFVFGLARGLPLLLVGMGAGWFARLNAATVWAARFQTAAGWLLLLGGAYFLSEGVRAAWTLYT